jgi:hypothetical protein
MKSGVDRGFCLSFWRLSYRRKFIRTICGSMAGVALLIFFQLNGDMQQDFDDLGFSKGELVGWVVIGIASVGSILQAVYYWRLWSCETEQNA